MNIVNVPIDRARLLSELEHLASFSDSEPPGVTLPRLRLNTRQTSEAEAV